MTCLIRANPATDLYWERSGQRLAESPKYQVQRWEVGEYQTTLGLFVNGLVTEDFGVYKCVATNEFGRAEEQIRINGNRDLISILYLSLPLSPSSSS